MALAARAVKADRAAYAEAIDGGDLVLGPSLRAAIHVVPPDDLSLYGRTAISTDDDELARQLGQGAMKGLRRHRIAPTEALAEVTEATRQTLAGGRRLDRTGLHDGLRERVRPELLPWCKGCQSNHVSPMLWRYAGVAAGMRIDSERRFRSGRPGRLRKGADLARAYVRFYGPAEVKGFTAWAGLAPAQGRRLWDEIAAELEEVEWTGGRGWIAAGDRRALDSPPQASGTRLIPPRDPYLQQADRETLVPDAGSAQAALPRGREPRRRAARRRSGGDVEGPRRTGRRARVRGRAPGAAGPRRARARVRPRREGPRRRRLRGHHHLAPPKPPTRRQGTHTGVK